VRTARRRIRAKIDRFADKSVLFECHRRFTDDAVSLEKKIKIANGCRRRIIADFSSKIRTKVRIIGDIKQEVARCNSTPRT